ncbi:methanol O-anthraniloyltransferase-like [Gossypium australe]|uniref:Methanol O-anthraniloyltransferase-like n=1 Tax=Gossypium australe TaxID=47621 RepID=A0A5B6UYB3_9ROSI|nr:methanol O-anthraniloyltransferase-like [Gossypium australe]
MSKRRKIKVGEQVSISVSCSVIISKQVPQKLKDLGRVLKDVLAKVCSFIIQTDFVILDFEKNHEIPILLGKPFLATSKSTIGQEKNELTIKINGETKIFKCGHQ